MDKKHFQIQRGFTVTELVITIMIAAIVLLGIGAVLSDSQKAWTRMNNVVFSETATDIYVARQAFDTVIRKATRERMSMDVDGHWLEIYCYEDEDSTEIDHYIRLYEDNGCLKVEHGKLDPKSMVSVSTICDNVSSCVFKRKGRSAQMILTLDDGNQTLTVVSSAILHN